MITKDMEEAFDTENENFTKMMEIIGKRMWTRKKDGDELHHIVPVTWYAQNDESRPSWMSVSVFGKAIRSSEEHPANDSSNLVYLSADEHNLVHRYMALCATESWEAPNKGKGYTNSLNPCGTYLIKNYNVKFDLNPDGSFLVKSGEPINFCHNDVVRVGGFLRDYVEEKVDFNKKIFTSDVIFPSEYFLFFCVASAARRKTFEIINVETNKPYLFK